MEPTVESRLGRRRSAATKGRGGCSGHGEVHVPALTSPRTPSTPQSQQAPSSMPYPPELQHRPPNPPWNFYPPGGFVNLINQHTSGYSDDQLMDEAQKMYANGNNGKPFTLVHWWKALRNEPKFCAHMSLMDKEKGRSNTIDITEDRDQFPQQRPIGRDAAKAQKNGKRKAEEVLDGIVLLGENINKIIEVQEYRKKEREKVVESQLEISRLQLKAAQEQEAKLLEVYSSLMQQDTSQLSDEAKLNREKTLQKMEQKLFGDSGEE